MFSYNILSHHCTYLRLPLHQFPLWEMRGTGAARYLCKGKAPHPQLLISRVLRAIPNLALRLLLQLELEEEAGYHNSTKLIVSVNITCTVTKKGTVTKHLTFIFEHVTRYIHLASCFQSHVQLSKYIQKAEQNITMAQKGLSSLYSSPVLSPHASTEHLPKGGLHCTLHQSPPDPSHTLT